ncbi:MAG: hypothetical protein KBF21_07640 [Thermoanaerobaculia bacterium]|nr:hypothetical protein [Thermoanaerobaculia bacterium]
MTSAELLETCTANGLMSKEAAASVAAVRARLIKQALKKEAAGFFGKVRGVFGGAKPKKELSFLEKLKSGGATGGGEPGWSDVGLNLTKMLGLAGLTAGATAGVTGLMRHSRDKQMANDIQSSYKQIFKENPDLNDVKDSAPGRVERHFGVLAKFAPSLAADPIVASSWLNISTKSNSIGPGEIKVLAETQTRIDEMNEARHGVRGVSPLKAGEFASRAMGGK